MKPAMWVIPATKEPWRNGVFGMCTNCGFINRDVTIAPNFCGKCGKVMTNSSMKQKRSAK